MRRKKSALHAWKARSKVGHLAQFSLITQLSLPSSWTKLPFFVGAPGFCARGASAVPPTAGQTGGEPGTSWSRRFLEPRDPAKQGQFACSELQEAHRITQGSYNLPTIDSAVGVQTVGQSLTSTKEACASARTLQLASCRSTPRSTIRCRRTSPRDSLPPVRHSAGVQPPGRAC